MGTLGIVLVVMAITFAVTLAVLVTLHWEVVLLIVAMIMLYKWLTNETGKKKEKKDKEEGDD